VHKEVSKHEMSENNILYYAFKYHYSEC